MRERWPPPRSRRSPGAGSSPLLISCGAAALGARGGRPRRAAARRRRRALPREAQRRRADLHRRLARAGRRTAGRAPSAAPQHPRTPARRRAGADRALRGRPGRRGRAGANRGGGSGARGSDQRRRLGRLLRARPAATRSTRSPWPTGATSDSRDCASRSTTTSTRSTTTPPPPADGGRRGHLRRAQWTTRTADRAERDVCRGRGDCGAGRGGGRPRRHLAARDIRRRADARRSRRAAWRPALLVRAAIPPRPAGKGGAALLRAPHAPAGADQRAGCAAGDERATDRDDRGRRPRSCIGHGRGRDRRDARAARAARRARGRAGHGSRRRGCSATPSCLGSSQPADRGLIGRCMRERRAGARVGDVSREPDYCPTPVTATCARSSTCRCWWTGALGRASACRTRCAGAFDDEDARLLRSVADQLAAALRAGALHERLERA